MEVVTHFVNDTVEFYKWSLTIAGMVTSGTHRVVHFMMTLQRLQPNKHTIYVVIPCCYYFVSS